MPKRPLKSEKYRESAAELRRMAQRTASAEIRAELLVLAERYDRLATRAEPQKTRDPPG
jgi:hypothetical protein